MAHIQTRCEIQPTDETGGNSLTLETHEIFGSVRAAICLRINGEETHLYLDDLCTALKKVAGRDLIRPSLPD